MFLVAVFFAWLGHHIHRSRVERPIISGVQQAGGSVYFNREAHKHPLRSLAPPTGSPLVRSIFGADIFASVDTVFLDDLETSDEDVAPLHRLTELRCVQLQGKAVTDKCVTDLLRIKRLSGLILSNTSISPEGLSRLAKHKQLRALTLEGAGFDDEYIKQVKQFADLQHLQLVSTAVTDNGMESIRFNEELQLLGIYDAPGLTDTGLFPLAQLPKIRNITISEARISDHGVSALQDALPNCDVKNLTGR